jgi:hypothetical protein
MASLTTFVRRTPPEMVRTYFQHIDSALPAAIDWSAPVSDLVGSVDRLLSDIDEAARSRGALAGFTVGSLMSAPLRGRGLTSHGGVRTRSRCTASIRTRRTRQDVRQSGSTATLLSPHSNGVRGYLAFFTAKIVTTDSAFGSLKSTIIRRTAAMSYGKSFLPPSGHTKQLAA